MAVDSLCRDRVLSLGSEHGNTPAAKQHLHVIPGGVASGQLQLLAYFSPIQLKSSFNFIFIFWYFVVIV